MKKLGLLVFIAALVGSVTLVWGITGRSIPSLSLFKTVTGSGNIITEKRDVSNFNGVDAGGAMRIIIIAGKDFSVELEGDDNIVPLVKTEVRGGVLHFDRTGKGWTRSQSRLTARVTMPTLNELNVSGASSADVSGVKSESLKIEASGASKIEISGEAVQAEIKVSGASRVAAEKLLTTRTKVEVSGASRASVFAAEALDADASGASRITYSGNPASVNKDASGASSIKAN